LAITGLKGGIVVIAPARRILRWDEKVDPPITVRVKLPVINALDGAITKIRRSTLEEE